MPKTRSLSEADAISLTKLIQFKVGRFVASSSALANQSEDLAQEAFARVLERIGQFDPARASLTTFVSRITESVLIDQSRRISALKRNPNRVETDLSSGPHRDSWSSPIDEAIQPGEQSRSRVRDLALDLVEAIQKLPADLQQLAADLQHQTVPEIAKRNGVHPGTIYRHLNSIRHRWDDGTLRDYLEP